jgi:uncharacterized membrane protein YkgB
MAAAASFEARGLEAAKLPEESIDMKSKSIIHQREDGGAPPPSPARARVAAVETRGERLRQLDQVVTTWMARYSVTLLRVSLGVVFLWFGALKLVPEASPAEELATRTIETLTFGVVKAPLSLPILAVWEVLIGLGLIMKRFMRTTIVLLLVQMSGTVAPLFLFRSETWTTFPIAGTLEGQYIIKNIVLVAAALVIGATVRGGMLVADKDLADRYRARFDRHRM